MHTNLEELHEDDSIEVESATEETPLTEGDELTREIESQEPSEELGVEEVTNGVEEFLGQFGIDGGMIEFEDGERKHFYDLDESEKANVLTSLAESGADNITQKYDLDEGELQLLSAARIAKMPIADYVNQLANDRVDQMLAIKESVGTDYTTMSDDGIYTSFLQDSNPNATEQEIADELDIQKQGKFYKDTLERIREQYVSAQFGEAAANERAGMEDIHNRLEQERFQIVDAVKNIDKVSDWRVTDEDKNEVLEKILEVNEYNDPIFLQEAFSSPENIFKAAYLFYNAEEKFDQMQNHFKKEMQEKYKQGRSDAMNGLPSEPISGSRSNNRTNPKTNRDMPEGREETTLDLNDLHSD
jgi:hypothetical protein